MTSQHDERLTAIHLLRAWGTDCCIRRATRPQRTVVPQMAPALRACGLGRLAGALTGATAALRADFHRDPRQLVIQARSELEAAAASGQGLKYVGGRAVRTKLQGRLGGPAPSVPTIERILRTAWLTQRRQPAELRDPLPACATNGGPDGQIDIVPHYLTGGQKVGCFNGLDVVSRYPTGQAYAQARSQDAAAFLIHFWQTVGIPTYTQVDNQDCFSGGHTHPYVLGQVVRLALTVGTELVFSPVYHPESNGYVETLPPGV